MLLEVCALEIYALSVLDGTASQIILHSLELMRILLWWFCYQPTTDGYLWECGERTALIATETIQHMGCYLKQSHATYNSSAATLGVMNFPIQLSLGSVRKPAINGVLTRPL